MSHPVTLTRQDRVGIIELNRPEVLNAVDIPMRRALLETFDAAGRDPELTALVLTGAGKAFCSGADLKSAAANPDNSLRRTARTLTHDIQPLTELITRLDKPVIAAVNGAAAGVGLSLALACDLMVMADDATLLPSFSSLGLIPDGGATWFLTRRIGYSQALEVLVEGKKLPADRCLELGICNRLSASAQLRETALAWASELAARPPLALTLTKRMARMSVTTGLSEVMAMEAELQTFLVSTEDTREAMLAFAEKRNPKFNGR